MSRGVVKYVPKAQQITTMPLILPKIGHILIFGLILGTFPVFASFIANTSIVKIIKTPFILIMDFIFTLISSILSWIPSISFESLTYPLTIIKDYLVIPLYNCIIYPLQWLYEHISYPSTPDITKIISENVQHHDDTTTSTPNKNVIEDKSSYKNLPQENTASKKDNYNKKNIQDIAIQHGINSNLTRLISIGAQSLKPQEIADAHEQGREEVKEQHRTKGALSLSHDDITKAFGNGRKEALQKHRDAGFNSLSLEEQTEAFYQGKTEKLQEILRNASRISEELTQVTYQNAVDASYISLLQRIEKEAKDHNSIIEKSLFCPRSFSLQEYNLHECKDNLLKSSQPIFDKEIKQHQYIIQIQIILAQLNDVDEILRKKKFCDAILYHHSSRIELPIEEAQKTTGLTYEDDGFCPPYK